MIDNNALRALICEWFPEANDDEVEKLVSLFTTAIKSWNELEKD